MCWLLLRLTCFALQGRLVHVDVETASTLCAGVIVADVHGISDKPANVWLTEVRPAALCSCTVPQLLRGC